MIRKKTVSIIGSIIIAIAVFLMYTAGTAAVRFTAGTGDEDEKQEERDDSLQWPAGPDISADAAIVVEQTTGLILYEKDIYTAYYPASTTKILTTLLALENSNLNETVTVSYEAEWYVSKASSRMGLVEG